ncbi:MAG: hypothetical protein U0871_01015 [Gemmataceae bacterium]
MNQAVQVADDSYTLFLKANGYSPVAAEQARTGCPPRGGRAVLGGGIISPLQ